MTKIALLVDDEPLIREVLREKLKKQFDVFLEAGNGREGLQHLQNNPGTMVVVSDLRMPLMDGITFLSEARSQGYVGAFVFFAAFATRAVIKQANDLGAFEFVEKGTVDGLDEVIALALQAAPFHF